MSGGHIFAMDPKVKPQRRRAWLDGDPVWVKVTPLLYSSDKRCRFYGVKGRPTWRCKSEPTVMVEWPRLGRGTIVCDEHLAALRVRP